MQKIYKPEVSNKFSPILLTDIRDRVRLSQLNFCRIKDSWEPVECDFWIGDKGALHEPDITNLVPGIAFRKEFKEKLFPESVHNIELLPIFVSGQEWLLVNSLCSTNKVNFEKSIVHRDPSGTIFMLQSLYVDDSGMQGEELFTVDGSNRSIIYVLDSFITKVTNLGLKGLNFKVIGELSGTGIS